MPKVSQAQKEATKRYEDKAYDKALIRMPSFYGGLCSTPKTLEEIKAMDKEFLVPIEISALLGCSPYGINLLAKRNPENNHIGSYTRILACSV